MILVGGAFSYRTFPKMVELAELLADHFTVLNYDRRGRGASGDARPYAVEREIEDLEALVEAAGGSASFWGWSSGSVLALRAAAHGPRIEKPVLYMTKGMGVPGRSWCSPARRARSSSAGRPTRSRPYRRTASAASSPATATTR